MVDDQGRYGRSFVPGERVAVPWGLDVLEGTVVSSHGKGPARRVVVSVELPDTEDGAGSQLVTLSEKDLTAAADLADERRPGSWLPAYHYEEELRRTLESLVGQRSSLGPLSLAHRHRSALDSRVDFTLNAGDRSLIIEAKSSTSGSIASKAIDQLLAYLRLSNATAGLLVTNTALSTGALARLREAAQEGYKVRAVKWLSPDDNTVLLHSIEDLLSAA